jgi:hypothetical protein
MRPIYTFVTLPLHISYPVITLEDLETGLAFCLPGEHFSYPV